MRDLLPEYEADILWTLDHHVYWYIGCGWDALGGPIATENQLTPLVRKGFVNVREGKYMVSEKGRKYLADQSFDR